MGLSARCLLTGKQAYTSGHMKILVQNCLTHLYLKTASEWTPDSSQAKVFSTSQKALDYCAANEIPAVQIILKFEQGQYDIKLPITEECEKLNAA